MKRIVVRTACCSIWSSVMSDAEEKYAHGNKLVRTKIASRLRMLRFSLKLLLVNVLDRCSLATNEHIKATLPT
jgi:hypothetical protein